MAFLRRARLRTAVQLPAPAVDHPYDYIWPVTLTDRGLRWYRLSIVWLLPAAIIAAAVGGLVAHAGIWMGLNGWVDQAFMVLVIVTALLSRWELSRKILGLVVTGAFLGRALTAMLYSSESEFRRPMATVFVWGAIWMFSAAAVARIHYVRKSDKVVGSP